MTRLALSAAARATLAREFHFDLKAALRAGQARRRGVTVRLTIALHEDGALEKIHVVDHVPEPWQA